MCKKANPAWSRHKEGWELKPEAEQMRWWSWIWVTAAARDSVMSKLIIFLCSLYSHFYVWFCPLIVMTGCGYTLLKMNTKEVTKEIAVILAGRRCRGEGLYFPLVLDSASVSLTNFGMTLENVPYSALHWCAAAAFLCFPMLKKQDSGWWSGGEGQHTCSSWHLCLLTAHVAQERCGT